MTPNIGVPYLDILIVQRKHKYTVRTKYDCIPSKNAIPGVNDPIPGDLGGQMPTF